MIVVLVLVLGGAPAGAEGWQAPLRAGVTDALVRSMGAEVVVRDLAPHELAGDESVAARALLRRFGASAVARVTVSRDVAVVWVQRAADPAPLSSRVAFSPADDPVDVGRAVGYVLGAMVSRGAAFDAPADVDATVAARSDASPEKHGQAATGRAYLEATGRGVAPLGGTGPRWGGALAAGWQLNPAWAVGVSGSWTLAQLAELDADAAAMDAEVQARASLWRSGPIDVSLVVACGAERLVVTHDSQDDPRPDRRVRWLPVAQAGLTVGARAFGPLSVIAAAGAEATAGSTALSVGDRAGATISPVRAFADLGLLARF